MEVRTTAVRAEVAEEAVQVEGTVATSQRNINPRRLLSRILSLNMADLYMPCNS
jgi:hypothetical protein